jgi:hypothetical protein
LPKILKKKTLTELRKDKPEMAAAIELAPKVHVGCFLIFTNRSKPTDEVLDDPNNQKLWRDTLYVDRNAKRYVKRTARY